MDNYLSHRWPGQPEPEALPRKKKKKQRAGRAGKGRRRLKVFLIVLLILLLLAGSGVGSWFLARHLFALRMGAALPDAGEPEVSQSQPAESDSGNTDPVGKDLPLPVIPRAELVEGVVLETAQSAGESMASGDIYEKILPSVVSVSVFKGEDVGYGAGSGIIMREDGYILTNYHVLEYGKEAAVMLLDSGYTYPATLVGYDEELDIAILKIEAEGLTAAEFGDSDALRVGDPAYAIGNPMGYLYGSMSEGIISFLNRAQTVGKYEMTLIQTTAVLNSGSSGGALVNESGQVIGITVAKVSGSISGSALVEGIGFAIPISAVRPYINRILAAGESWKPTIGITCYEGEMDGTPGIMIATVEAGTPALAAGLREGDFIIAANGTPVDTVYSLKRVLGEVGVGGTVTCTVRRGSFTMDISFTLIDSSELSG